MEGGKRVGWFRAGGAERIAEIGTFRRILEHIAGCDPEDTRVVASFRAGARVGGWKERNAAARRRRGGSWLRFADLMLMGRVGVVWRAER